MTKNTKMTKILALFSVTILFVTFLCIFCCGSISASADTDTISLNEMKKVSLDRGETKTFYFTTPTNQYYVVDTTGKYATRLRISNLPTGEIIGTPRFYDDNARVCFKAEAGRQIKIEIKLDKTYISGSPILQVRKQRFALFGYVDGGNTSTIKDLDTPYNKFKSIFDTVKYENLPHFDAISLDERNLSKFNSEIVFFSGHGDGTHLYFYANGLSMGSISVNDTVEVNKIKVAMFSACKSAYEDSSNPLSIARYIQCGVAETTVGFKNSVTFSSARKFTNKFFTKLAEGSSVYTSASKGAAAVLWPWDNVKKYTVFGKGEINVTDNTPTVSTFSLPIKNTQRIRDELSSNYVAESIGDNEYRYYEVIDGCLSSNYIDVTEENGEIVDYEDGRKNYETALEINEDYINKDYVESISMDGSVYKLRTEEEHIVYYNFDGVMTPIKISFSTYENSDGIFVYEATCINLFNGEIIDYDAIS